MTKTKKNLEITGIKENNLKDLDLKLIHDQLVTITGLSGSGKSTLTFDTVYAEGQRRYLETFSPYIRQFLDKIKKPEIEHSENIRPALAIQQKTKVSSSRSSVGTLTDINDYLCILFANLAVPYTEDGKSKLIKHGIEETAEEIINNVQDCEQYYICTPIQLEKTKKALLEQLKNLEQLGFYRFMTLPEHSVWNLNEDLKQLKPNQKIQVVIDRFKSSSIKKTRLREAIKQAYQLSRGILNLVKINKQKIELICLTAFYSDPKDPDLEIQIPVPRAGHFSSSNPLGACDSCRGFGAILEPDPKKVILDANLSIESDAIDCWKGSIARSTKRALINFCKEQKIDTKIAWKNLKQKEKDLIFDAKVTGFAGIKAWFKKVERKAYKTHVRIFLSKYRSQFNCKSCSGSGLKFHSRLFRLNQLSINQVQQLEIINLSKWLKEIEPEIKAKKSKELQVVYQELTARIKYLLDLGLSYLSLNRPARTLSGGETQRVNLAAAIGSELVSTQFVLDEPTVGLHPRDTDRLLSAIKDLQQRGNSVLMVEHDLDCIQAADQIIQLGPQAGHQGGNIVYQGKVNNWKYNFEITKPKTKITNSKDKLSIKNAKAHNLKNLNFDIPCNSLVVLSGVSGSGKSTIAEEIIIRNYDIYKGKSSEQKTAEVKGYDHFQQVLAIDQSGLAKSPRANIATYSGIWDAIRTALADTNLAQQKLLTKSAFSFNVDAGRCPECKGIGAIKEEMQFLSDVYVPCELCLGKRFQEAVLEVKYQDRNAYQWLQTTVSECKDLLNQDSKAKDAASNLIALGLGHLTLGHALSQLSGGEAQRLKLVPFIQKSRSGNSLLIFDEPTTGLHLEDVQRLIQVFQTLINQGHSLVCIEHNQEILLAADHIIDLGPEGGSAGGEIILTGSPKDFLQKKNAKNSLSAKYLQDYFQKYSKAKDITSKKTSDKAPKDNFLEITNAKEHNLKDISIKIPHDQMLAITGVSGSGKSTLAKDIIYAEGQRKYLDCLSPYARHYIHELSKPDIGSITNLRPTVCVYQHTFQPGRLSTVGTMSEVYNYLRLLFAKAGDQYCGEHPKQLVTNITAEDMLANLKKFGDKSVRLLAPIIKQKKGYHRAVFAKAREQEIEEVRVDGKFGAVGKFDEGLSRNQAHDIDFVWAKVIPNRVPEDLLLNAIEEVSTLSGGSLIVNINNKDHVYSTLRGCPVCNIGYFRPDPEDLSFNSRRGRCEACNGTGLDSKQKTCKSCNGSRLKPYALNIKLNNQNIFDLSQLTAKDLKDFFDDYKFSKTKAKIAEPVLDEIKQRLNRMIKLGIDYIPLNRSCKHLSKGELQRLRLANAIGSPLSGVLYIFDEPSAGLHPKNTQAVINELKDLKERNNSVIIIEHDLETIKSCDHIIEIGPGGGKDGGQIIFNDKKTKYRFPKQPNSKQENKKSNKPKLKVKKATRNNIKNLKLDIPLESLVTIAGVSGAGKSTLLNSIILETILPLNKSSKWESEYAMIETEKKIDRVLIVDQSPIGKNSRSTPASYLKIWDEVRKLLAQTPVARSRGWNAGYFSYNSDKGGRCPECKGQGRQKLEMNFLAEAFVTCSYCNAKRYTDEALSVRYLDLNAAEILNLTFEEAKTVFANYPKIFRLMKSACDLGLGYLTLGQSSATLSGGESQRIKLTQELAVLPRGHTLYVLDEPTVGLHQKDVELLIKVLKDIVARGDSIIIIEHDELIIQDSDHVITMGPGAGDKGGKIIKMI